MMNARGGKKHHGRRKIIGSNLVSYSEVAEGFPSRGDQWTIINGCFHLRSASPHARNQDGIKHMAV